MLLYTTLTKERQKCNLIKEQENKECERTLGLNLKELKKIFIHFISFIGFH